MAGLPASFGRTGRLADTLAGREAAERHELAPIKINTVVLRRINDSEIAALGRLTLAKPWRVRKSTWLERFVPAAGPLLPVPGPPGGGAGAGVKLPGGRGHGRRDQSGQRTLLFGLQPAPADRRRPAPELFAEPWDLSQVGG